MFKVTASITVRVVIVNESSGVKRLVNITDVVDDQSQRERSSIVHVRESRQNSLVVVAALVGSSIVGKPIRKILESVNNVVLWHHKGVIIVAIIVVGLVYEVPA